jgi:HNH endonuclease
MKKICSVEGCEKPHHCKGMCATCYHRILQRKIRYGRETLIRRENGTGSVLKGYIYIQKDGKKKMEHVSIAEKALGKPLPKGAEVHHVDGNKANNNPTNLVICPNRAYHMLLHKRMRDRSKNGQQD